MELYKAISLTNDWGLILPEIMLGVLALALLTLEFFLPPKQRTQVLPNVAVVGLLGVFLYYLYTLMVPGSWESIRAFGGLIGVDPFTNLMRAFFLLTAVPVCYFGQVYLERRNLPRTEFFALVLIATAAMMLLAASRNFAMLFIALETATIAFYILVAYCRESLLSLEAGLKYVILGGLSSAILLFGIVLLYGAAGNPNAIGATGNGLDFLALGGYLQANAAELPILARLGILMVFAGIAFKIGAVPFQVWIPDVYQGAPTPVTSFLAVGSKAAGFAVLTVLVAGPFAATVSFLVPAISVVAMVTILYGNLCALGQQNLKRLMGLSGIAHAGYLLLGVAALASGEAFAMWAIAFYLVTYLVSSFCVFGVMVLVDADDEQMTLSDHRALLQRQGFLAGILTIGLASLAGIPPLAGFIGKLLVFVAAVKAGLWLPLAIAAIGVAMSIYYYFGWIREALFGDAVNSAVNTKPITLTIEHKLALGSLALAVLLLGIFQGS